MGKNRNDLVSEAEELLKDGAVTVANAVREYGIGRSRLYELMGRGELPYSDANGRRLIPRIALRRIIAAGMKGMATAGA